MNLPFKVRAKIFRQRLILTVRYWFHLPQDDLKEQRLRDEIEGLVKLNAEAVQAVRSLTMIAQQLQLRLAFYETHMPRLRDLRARFEREQQRRRESAAEAMRHGVLVPPTNGKSAGVDDSTDSILAAQAAALAHGRPKVVEVPLGAS